MVCAGVMRASRKAQPISLEEVAPPLGSEWPVGINQARREVKRQRGEVESVSLCRAGSHGSTMPLRTGPGAQPAGQGVGVSREWADVSWEGSTRTCHSAEIWISSRKQWGASGRFWASERHKFPHKHSTLWSLSTEAYFHGVLN